MVSDVCLARSLRERLQGHWVRWDELYTKQASTIMAKLAAEARVAVQSVVNDICTHSNSSSLLRPLLRASGVGSSNVSCGFACRSSTSSFCCCDDGVAGCCAAAAAAVVQVPELWSELSLCELFTGSTSSSSTASLPTSRANE